MVLLFGTPLLYAQDPDSIRDYHGDEFEGHSVLRRCVGQIFNSNGTSEGSISYYHERADLGIFLRKSSKVSFTYSIEVGDSSVPDLGYRIDMNFFGATQDPVAIGDPVSELCNYYRGSFSAEAIEAYNKVSYISLWESINAYFYHASSGPRMAFVVMPGGDPEEIKIGFTGQDSIKVDLDGALRLYLSGGWIKLEQAVAYQVDANNDVVPISWTATYEANNGTGVVKFGFDTYDEGLPLIFQIGYLPDQGGAMGGSDNLTWSTSAGRDIGYAGYDYIMAGDKLPDHDLIVTGATADPLFPAQTGTLLFAQNKDVFVSRYNYAPSDSESDAELIWTTFISGSGYDMPIAMKYGAAHERIYVGGYTNGTSWPMRPFSNPADGTYYQSSTGGQTEGFMIKLTEDGILERSTLYGGAGHDIVTTVVADDFGGIHFFGITDTEDGSTTPCQPSGSGLAVCDPGNNAYFQNNNAGGFDMFIARFDADFNLTYGSFIGGAGDDRVFDSDYYSSNSDSSARIAIAGGTVRAPISGAVFCKVS
ncbi:MAG: hypothetical protein IPL52_13240 [Flavobacteriales bacterium]|nr:hypothetical protein [Flavobacteriales bacterium]